MPYGDITAYDKAIFVTSDADGTYKVDLPPGKYWIGSKGKALNPINYTSGAIGFLEKVAVVNEGAFTQIDICLVGLAPGIAPTPHPDGVVMHDSGIAGTTSSFVTGGMAPGRTTGGRRSLEFAIAPIEGDITAYDKAIFVISEADGTYRVVLPPGKYWIGPKGKAVDPVNYVDVNVSGGNEADP